MYRMLYYEDQRRSCKEMFSILFLLILVGMYSRPMCQPTTLITIKGVSEAFPKFLGFFLFMFICHSDMRPLSEAFWGAHFHYCTKTRVPFVPPFVLFLPIEVGCSHEVFSFFACLKFKVKQHSSREHRRF